MEALLVKAKVVVEERSQVFLSRYQGTDSLCLFSNDGKIICGNSVRVIYSEMVRETAKIQLEFTIPPLVTSEAEPLQVRSGRHFEAGAKKN